MRSTVISKLNMRQTDRGGVPDLSVSGNNFDFGGSRPSRSDYDERTRSANAIAEPTPCGYRPCGCKISLITKINPCTQSKNAQEQEASNLKYHSKVES